MLDRLMGRFRPATPQALAPVAGAGPQETEWRPGDIILDRYRVEGVASGAMGKVYIAQHLGWKIPVAIKVPKAQVLADPEGCQRILTEADSWVRMGMHPNVATCYYVLSLNGVPHLFIEYVDGGDLGSWLAAGRCNDPRTTLSMAIQLCHGMEFTHASGIIHRDLKPQNILVTKNALVKITDFGIVQSRWRPDLQDQGGLAGKGDRQDTVGFRGTPGYASPEQFVNSHAVDRRSDLFSFGICLWLMFCGRKPYLSNQRPVETVSPSPRPGAGPFPEALVYLLTKAVAVDPARRYQDFSELRQDLNQAHLALYRVDCPYMEVDFTDLEAENYNNRAVSFLELGKGEEAGRCLGRALDINDSLPEAIYNHTLRLWREGERSGEVLRRRLAAARRRLPAHPLLDSLAQALRGPGPGQVEEASPGACPLEYVLCLPKNSVEVFRSGQLRLASQRNIADLLAKGRHRECYQALRLAWDRIGLRRDPGLQQAYEGLLPHAMLKGMHGLVRLSTLPAVTRGGVAGLRLLAGGRQLLFLTPEGKVMIRPYGPERTVKTLGRFPRVSALAVSPDGRCLALAAPGDGVWLLPVASGPVERRIATPGGEATALAFSPDSSSLACGYDSGRLLTVDLASGRQFLAAAERSGPVRSLVHAGPRHGLVSGHEDGGLCFWEPGTRECQRQLAAHALPVTILVGSGDGAWFVSAAADRVLKLWNRRAGQCLKSLKPHEEAVNDALILPDASHFLTAGDDDLIKAWVANTGIGGPTVEARGDGVLSLAPGPAPHLFLAGGNDGGITAWMVIHDLEFF